MGVDTRDVQKHQGASMNVVPELAVLETLTVGFGRLRQNEDQIAELVERSDALRLGSQDVWEKDLRESLLDLLDPASPNAVRIALGHPASIADLPWISVVLHSGGEEPGGAVSGDELHRTYQVIKPTTVDPPLMLPSVDPTALPVPDNEQLLIRHQVTGTRMTSTVQIAVWSIAPERGLLLQAAARWAMWEGRGRLWERGIYDLTWQEGTVEPSQELQPRIGYLPLLTYTLSWTWRRTRTRLVPNRVSIASGSFSA